MRATALATTLDERLADAAASRKTRQRFRAEDLCRRGRRAAVEQLAFIQDRARWKVACCSRRAGKTTACAILLLQYALEVPEAMCLYVTLTRLSGKRIVWRRLQKLNRDYGLGGHADRSELTLTFPNGSTIWVTGAKDEEQMEKLRGIDPAPRLVVIDEAQAFKDYVQELVDDVLVPMLIETKGTLVLIGTPGKIRSGYFHEACRSANDNMRAALNVEPANDNGARRAWSVHHWTIRENPFIDDVDAELADIRRRKGWTPEAPTYQREYLGRWVTEHDALVYKYDVGRNGYRELPDHAGPEWRCALVVDQGYHDADAIGALWFRPHCPGVWLEELHHERKQSAGDLVAAAVRLWQPLRGRCIVVLWDEGGGGKKVAEDARRQGLPAEPADKPAKVAGIELTNSALMTGCLKVPENGHAASDAGKVTWDPKARGVKLSERYHTDMWDVVVYGMRRLVGVVPLDRPAELPVHAGAEELAEAERSQRIRARVKENERSWVEKAVGMKKRRANALIR